ncbi:MAG: hypothetical protein V2B13_13450 [Pseudomonadota bacterium]
MKIPHLLFSITLILFLLLGGTVSLAQDKKAVSPAPTGPQPGTLSDQNKPPDRDCAQASTPVPPEKKQTDPESLTPPPIKIQEGTNAEG